MTPKTIRLSIVVTVALAAVAAACSKVADDISALPSTDEFSATLTGANERPTPVTTSATGQAVFSLVQDTFLVWRVDVASIDTPTAVHIHGPANATQTAGVILSLGGSTRNIAGYSGAFGSGQVKKAALATAAVNFDSLLTLIRNGNAYVNVHTKRNPAGEIRGQLP